MPARIDFAMTRPPRILVLALLAALAGRASADRPVTYERDVLPILTRAGCNAGACHGKARGQNGFQLSLLGFDSDFDFAAIAKEGRGRRGFPASPRDSLLLLKATATIPHGGGRRLDPQGEAYAVLSRWIEQGMPRTPADA